MPIPYDKIKADLKSGELTRVNQLFEYATIPEWKEAMGCRKGLIERLIQDPKRYIFRWESQLADAAGLKLTTVERLIEGQKRYNRLMKKEGGQPGE